MNPKIQKENQKNWKSKAKLSGHNFQPQDLGNMDLSMGKEQGKMLLYLY